MITYENYIKVKLDGKTVGTIKQDKWGYWLYKPNGSTWGEQYPSLQALKNALEAE